MVSAMPGHHLPPGFFWTQTRISVAFWGSQPSIKVLYSPPSFLLLVKDVVTSLFGASELSNLLFKHLPESLEVTRRGGKAQA